MHTLYLKMTIVKFQQELPLRKTLLSLYMAILIFPRVSSVFPWRKIQYSMSVYTCYPNTRWAKHLKNLYSVCHSLLLNNRPEEEVKILFLFSLLYLNDPRDRSHVNASLMSGKRTKEWTSHPCPFHPAGERKPCFHQMWRRAGKSFVPPLALLGVITVWHCRNFPLAVGAACWVIIFSNSRLFTLQQISYSWL